MVESSFEHPVWWRSLTIAERWHPDASQRPSLDRPATAERRLAEWRSQTPFRKKEWLLRRFELDGLDLDSFRALLGEAEASLQGRIPSVPSWLEGLRKAFADLRPAHPMNRLPVVGPLVVRAAERLLREAEDLVRQRRSTPFEPERVVEQIVATIVTRFDRMISKAVVLEMKMAALRGSLQGESPQERFQSFLEHLRKPAAALAFLREYPPLARLLVESIDLWTESSLELLRRLSADWEMVRCIFWPDDDPGSLESVNLGLGDLHRGGQGVCVLRFHNAARLVYKPRSLRIDGHFAQLLAWLNARGAPDLRTPYVLDRGPYGWCEFVAHTPCRDQQEARRFYERQGALLALLHVLNANDFHRENLIAAGEHPIPVDLETLCGPDFGQAQETCYDTYAEFELQNSVVRVMLLPFFQEGKGRRMIDKSGMGGGGGQLTLGPEPEWEGLGTDDLRLVWKRREIPAVTNRPILDGEPLNASAYVPEIEKGFVSMYRLLQWYRDELLEEGSPLATMEEDEVRVVFRASELYGMILEQGFHPDFLGDALDRERLFDRLWFGMDRSLFPHVALRLLPHERRDLWRGEIPHFVTRAGSLDLWTSRGERVPDFFLRSGLDMVRARLGQLGEEDLRRQVWYVRGALTALTMNHQPVFGRYSPTVGLKSVECNQLRTQAVAVAERLSSLARWNEDRVSWVGLAYGGGHGWHLRPLQTDLYSGLPGVALFLAYAGAVTGRDEFRTVAEGAVATLRRQIARRRTGLEIIGGFDGWGGLLYLWAHLAWLWQKESLLAEADAMLMNLEALADSDDQLDVLRGSAGAIVPLLVLHRMTGSERALALARRLGNRLVGLARPFDGGVGWIGALFPVYPLTGFSHGASGIGWSLAELFAATGEAAYARTALKAVAFERSHFYPETGNWADLRSGSIAPGEQPQFMAAWCHGACGIGLSRLRMQLHLDDEMIQEDLRVALATTFQQGFGCNHSLCHGDLGSLQLLLEASRWLPGKGWSAKLEERTSQTLATIEEYGWRCGVPLEVETPGLMEGLAGIGYGLLRLSAPAQIPAVLLLEGPIDTENRVCLSVSTSARSEA